MQHLIMKLREWKKGNPRTALAICSIIIFLCGYGIGREHVKYELRKSIGNALQGLTDEEPIRKDSVLDSIFQKESPVSMKLLKKEGIEYNNPYMDGYEYIGLNADFTNTSNKNIRAFDATMIFSDLFDKKILDIGITYEDGLKAGETKNWEGAMDFNQFINNHQRLLDIDQKDLQIELEMKTVIYEDGTKEEY